MKKKIKKDSKKIRKSKNKKKIKEKVLEEIIRKSTLKEIKEKFADSGQFIEERSSPVLEKIAEKQEVFWTRKEEQEEEKENLKDYSLENSNNEKSDYDAPAKNFNQELLIDNNPTVNLIGRNSERDNQKFIFDIPENRIERDFTKNPERDYLNPEKFKHKKGDMSFEEQENKYKQFKPNL